MPTERIEIRPGTFIEVNAKFKQRAGIARGTRLKKHAMSESERRSIFGNIVRDDNPNVIYPTLLLDEAVRLSAIVGEKKACKITGVKYWSLKGRKRTLIREGKYKSTSPNPGTPRYTLAQKQACVKLAKRLMADPATRTAVVDFGKHKAAVTYPKWSQRTAFVEAGKRLGVNGRSVEFMWAQGMIP